MSKAPVKKSVLIQPALRDRDTDAAKVGIHDSDNRLRRFKFKIHSHNQKTGHRLWARNGRLYTPEEAAAQIDRDLRTLGEKGAVKK